MSMVLLQHFEYFIHTFRLQCTMIKLYDYIFYESFFFYWCNLCLAHWSRWHIAHNTYTSKNPIQMQLNQKVLVFMFVSLFVNLFQMFSLFFLSILPDFIFKKYIFFFHISDDCWHFWPRKMVQHIWKNGIKLSNFIARMNIDMKKRRRNSFVVARCFFLLYSQIFHVIFYSSLHTMKTEHNFES